MERSESGGVTAAFTWRKVQVSVWGANYPGSDLVNELLVVLSQRLKTIIAGPNIFRCELYFRRFEFERIQPNNPCCFATCGRSSVKLLRGAGGSVQCTIAIVSRSLSIAVGGYTIRLSDESSRMAKRKARIRSIRRGLLEAPYHVDYSARKHDISAEQAQELMQKLGRDQDKLNEAASKLFRR